MRVERQPATRKGSLRVVIWFSVPDWSALLGSLVKEITAACLCSALLWTTRWWLWRECAGYRQTLVEGIFWDLVTTGGKGRSWWKPTNQPVSLVFLEYRAYYFRVNGRRHSSSSHYLKVLKSFLTSLIVEKLSSYISKCVLSLLFKILRCLKKPCARCQKYLSFKVIVEWER